MYGVLKMSTDTIAQHFRKFVDATRDATPLYEKLSLAVAEDRELIEALMVEDGEVISSQPLPNILFGAVNDLRGDAPYPGIETPDNPYPAFRQFALEHQNEIRVFFKTRTVQTNEVRRCALWLSAFSLIAERLDGQPLGLLEVGASAGLNLLWDHYGYHYSDGMKRGDLRSPLQLECEVRGKPLSITDPLPTVAERIGIDLHPVNVQNTDAVRWLQALLWVEQPERAERLKQALSIAAQHPPKIIQGDAIEVFAQAVAQISSDLPLCVYHSFTLNQFSPQMRDQFTGRIEDEAKRREHLFRLSIEWLSGMNTPELQMVAYHNGAKVEERLLARVDHHGRWIEWL
jgi:hypothetical protein